MVYIKKTVVKGNLYYELVKCERDETGKPKQKHLKYLGKNLIDKKDIKIFEEEFKGYNLKTKNLTKIIHSIMQGNHGLLDLEILYKKSQNQGINKKDVDRFILEHLTIKKFIKIENKDSKSKRDLPINLINSIEKTALEKVFLKDTLEKVVRLNILLKKITENPILKKNLIFFGGTAINSIYQNYERLSVDIDLQATSSSTELREKIKEEIRKIINSQNYLFSEKNYKMDQFIIKFETNSKEQDKIKLEINHLDTQPILPSVLKNVKSPIGENEFKIKTLVKEELFAKKISALLNRTATRDLYDVFKFENFDIKLIRKCLIANSLLREKNIKKLINPKIFEPTIQDFNNYLKPVISQKEKIELSKMNQNVNRKVLEITNSITKKEIEFAKNFNPENPNFEKLFEDIKINPLVNQSPLLKLHKK